MPRELEGRGNVDSWEMIPLCKGQMEMTLGQPLDRSSLGLFLVRRDDDCEGQNNETILRGDSVSEAAITRFCG